MPQPYTQFKLATSIGDTMLTTNLENNLKTFLDWCFLGIGGFVNVSRPTPSSFGGSFDTLYLSNDRAYTSGTVFETIRKDWIWETGVSYSGISPIAISGVYVNGTLATTGDATYGHYYDYANGRVVFNSGIPAAIQATGITMDYSYRTVQVYKDGDADWFRELQQRSLRPGDSQWTNTHISGDYAVSPQHRIQLPAIIIKSIKTNSTPYEMGNGTLWVKQDVMFNIVADNASDRDRLKDILISEEGHNIWLYDTDTVHASGLTPIDYRGMLINTTGIYSYLVDTFPMTKCMFDMCEASEVESVHPNLYEAKVRITCEVALSAF